MALLTSGIVVDDYKLDDYIKALDSAGFNDYTLSKYSGGEHLSLIQVICEQNKIPALHQLCEQLEIFFKTRRN